MPHQREDVSALDRFNVHRCPTRQVFSGTGLKLMTCQPWSYTLTTGLPQPNSVAQQPMKARAYCVHPSIRDHWALRCMSRCPKQVVSLKTDPRVSAARVQRPNVPPL
ncbi:hypothetical protein TNCV_4596631 [Trichonephila clavipes]|uniref:Uncharacterized protein n=1 Tax=Trichonephila clavipes TaxID=2585209 RepID=A0A8X6WFN6_TRICX|nr:hypothetical protein TNCV_4596631 [Trichonephila clavipes]